MDSDDKLAVLEELRTDPEQTKKLEEFGRECGLAKLYFIKTYPPKIFFGARPTNVDQARLDDIRQKLILLINIKDFKCRPVEIVILITAKEELELLLAEMKPYLNSDGGDMGIKSIDEANGIVVLYLLGACSTCPSAIGTLKVGVERHLQTYLPWVNTVESAEKSTEQNFGFPDLTKEGGQ